MRWSDIPQNLYGPIASQLLFCLASDVPETVRISSISMERLIDSALEPQPHEDVEAIVEPSIPELFELIRTWGFSEVYNLIQCCLYYHIGRGFLEADDQIQQIHELLDLALKQTIPSQVANTLRFLGFLVSVLNYNLPSHLFQTAVWAANEGTYQMKHAAIELICHRVERFDVPEELGMETWTILMDMIMAPAMDIVDRLLDCMRAVLTRADMQDGFAHFLIHEWEDFRELEEKFDEISERIAGDKRAESVEEAIVDIREMIRRELPRPYEQRYSTDLD
jgi:hypothetical protein